MASVPSLGNRREKEKEKEKYFTHLIFIHLIVVPGLLVNFGLICHRTPTL